MNGLSQETPSFVSPVNTVDGHLLNEKSTRSTITCVSRYIIVITRVVFESTVTRFQ